MDKFLFDTGALVDLSRCLPHFPFKPYITRAVMDELLDLRQRYEAKNPPKKSRNNVFLKDVRRAQDFYLGNSRLVVSDVHDPTLESMTDLIAKRVAYDVYVSLGCIKREEVEGTELNRFGIEAGKLLLDRIHQKGIFRDNLCPYVIKTAKRAQYYAERALREHRGVMRKPLFDVDLTIFGTARRSDAFQGCHLFLVSNDGDLKDLVNLVPQVSDRTITCVDGRTYKDF